MITAVKAAIKRRWPPLHLRTILFGTLLFTAALPGVGALFLRVYENTLVRQTEAELVAQGAALTAAAQALWPGQAPPAPRQDSPTQRPVRDYRPEASTIDLRSTPVLAERPRASAAAAARSTDALAAGRLLFPIVGSTQQTTLASIQLVDRHGLVALGHEAGGSYAQLPEVAGALQGKVSTVLRRNGAYSQRYAFEWLSRASSLRIHHVRPIVLDGQVVGALLLSRSPRALFRGLYEDRGKIILGIVLILLVLIVLTGLLSRGIARPIEALARATRQVAAGTASVPDTPVTAAIEIRDLFENFRSMAEAVDRRSHYLRDFAASVSHEFKTPLTGIAGTIELIEDHGDDMTTVERERFLRNMRADTERLSQLVARLLDLARADMAEVELDLVTDALAAICRTADAYDTPDFRVVVASGAAPVHVAASTSTIEAVLGTLVTNARQAGATQAEIRIVRREPAVDIFVSDDGAGISSADRQRIFEPFFTTRRASGGTGLGLAISTSLLRASGGELNLHDSGSGGSCFVVTLLLASDA